jgi:two-component system, NtrC family, sensor kinase
MPRRGCVQAGESKKVLIADDDPAQRRLLRHYLQRWGYAVVEAADGDEALAGLIDGGIGLAVLDWNMPGRSGVDVCRELQRAQVFVHAIVLTANSERGQLGEALATGASDFILKPVDPVELSARLRVGARVLTLLERLAQLRTMESIGSLAAGIAHEINTPAQSVISNLHFLQSGWSELAPLLEACEKLGAGGGAEAGEAIAGLLGGGACDLGFLREEVPQAIGEARKCVESIARIVGAVREFAKAGDSSSARLRAADLGPIVEDAIALARQTWAEVAELEAVLDPKPQSIAADTGALLQAAYQLLINAAEAIAARRGDASAPKGQIRVTTSHDATHAELRVADDGTGIAEEVQPRIYDPFFTTKSLGQGMGQGLTLVHSVVVGRHGGTVRFETAAGRGTTFIVRLPLGPC